MRIHESNIKYEIVVSPDISEELNTQIFRYWSFGETDFKYPLKDFESDFEITKPTLEEVHENSKVKMILTHCTLCFNAIHVFAKNRKEFISHLSGAYPVCEKCKMFSPNYDENIKQKEPIEVRLQQLDKNELRVLHGIITLKKKALVYQHIFNNDIMDTKVWRIVNTLQRKDLIWVERDDNCRIVSFNFNPKLIQIIEI